MEWQDLGPEVANAHKIDIEINRNLAAKQLQTEL